MKEEKDNGATAQQGHASDSDDTSSLPPNKLEDQNTDDRFDTWEGWVVVAAASCIFFIYLGIIYSWGVLESELVSTRSFSLTTMTFVGSLATSFMVSIGFLVGMLIRRIGYRRTTCVGALLMGLGEFLASWTTKNLAGLFICHGVIFGIGGGLTILPSSTVPLLWFRKHRGLATGAVFGGGSLGAAIMSVAANLLVAEVGASWTFRIFGLLLWGVCIPASLFIRQPTKTKASVPKPQWYRFKERKFLVLFIGSGLGCFPLFVPSYFIPIFARVVASQRVAIIILAFWNVASTVGRLGAGFLADSKLGPLNSLVLSLFLAGISSLVIWPFASSIAVLSVFIVINGIGCGAFFSLIPTTVGSMFGAQNALGILPLLWLGWFFGYFFGSPIAAGLYSMADKDIGIAAYRPAAYYTGAMSIAGMLIIIAVRCMYSRKFLTRV
ncbi:uncharacterized protein N7469_000876 [Penicillium citrinum]|uniref:Major facilitator superfamily (MFS) profile domain-containing protein n=1 Tax=Penicillium citrinum TaxID=5077 RepID=A0A9W9PFX2_PENCI|nr:uncharacterized protein N7469_000876 [Penicillium citrinum]KAJ5242549.1 hypothetical protein N7469_000876 [Penicillium citrinum]